MSRAKGVTKVESASARREKREKRLERRLREVEDKVQSNPHNVGNPRKARNAILSDLPVNVPKVNSLIASGQCLDPMCRVWCQYQKRPWDGPTAYMGRPLDCLTNNGEPFCAAAPAQRYLSTTITADVNGNANIILFPEGFYNIAEDDLRIRRVTINGTTCITAPLDLLLVNDSALFGFVRQNGTSVAPALPTALKFWDSTVSISAAGTVTPLVWPAKQAATPFTYEDTSVAGQGFRLVGMGARLYPTSDVSSISGYAYASNIAGFPEDGVTLVDATQGTPQWKQQAFSERRVFEWSMGHSGFSCLYGHEVESQTSVAATTTSPPCRIVLGVAGADAAETFQLEVFAYYRVINAGSPTMAPGYKTPNEAAIQNAISASHDQDRRDVVKSVAQEHALAHPVLHKVVHASKMGIEAINAVKGIASAIGFGN